MNKWERVKLGEVFEFQRKSKIKAGEGLENGLYPFYTSSQDLSMYLDEYEHEGDALIFGTGGKASVHYNRGKFSVSTDCYVVKPKNINVFTIYIYYYLSGNIYILEKGFKGAGLKHISKEYLFKIEIPLPPLSIQQEIAERLDKMATLIEKSKAQLSHYDALAESLFIELFGDPITNEKGWEISTFGAEFKILSGGTPKTNIGEYWEGGNIPWIGSNMCKNEIIYQNDGKFITQKGLENSSTKVFEANSVLVALVGATIGKTALLKFDTAINQNIAGIMVSDKFNSYFVFYCLRNLYGKFLELGESSFKMANLSFVRNLEIPLPPLSLQQAFAEMVENIEEQKTKIRAEIEQAEQGFQALLQESF